MNRTQKLKLNSVISLINRIVRIASGLILPRLILLYFGSSTYGLVASLTQFLSIITFLDLGVGSVVQSALYKPMATNNNEEISKIVSAANKYFKSIAIVLIAYVFSLIILYPVLIDSSYGFLSTAFLILALSISLFGQYYLGIVNELVLNANQQGYIQYLSEIVVVILNLFLSVLIIMLGGTIQVVQLGAGLVFLLRPVFLSYYVRKNFNIDYNIKIKKDPLTNRWSGIGQHVAYSIQNSTDVVVLTIFSTLENVSVYSVYNMVVQAIHLIITSLTTGLGSFFGNALADNDRKKLNHYFDKVEWITHTVVFYLYGITIVLINSFVGIYTIGVDDINYQAYVFSFLLVLAKATHSLRTPYQAIIFSAGHFKTTQLSSFIEAGLNIGISIVFVHNFGLVGVAIGTLISMAYRTIYLVVYLANNILHRPINIFLKHVLVDSISLVLTIGLGALLLSLYEINTIVEWGIVAVILSLLSFVLLIVLNLIFYKDILTSTIKSFR